MRDIWIVLTLLGGLVCLYLVGGTEAAVVALRRRRQKPFDPERAARGNPRMAETLRKSIRNAAAFRRAVPPQVWTLEADVSLRAFAYVANPDSRKWVILLHGYRGSHLDMEPFALAYAKKGYNALLPDLRAHGASGGKWIGMGWTDRLDALQWVTELCRRQGDEIQVVLHGHSMGAATALMASGEMVPPAVRAVVADSAYTSVWEEFSSRLKAHKCPQFLLHPARLVAAVAAGYDIRQASTVEQAKRSHIPTLVIHGDQDDFVPTWMARPIFDALAGEKELLYIPGAHHVRGKETDPARYYGTVFRFLGRYVLK